jgi:hypothetical protein
MNLLFVTIINLSIYLINSRKIVKRAFLRNSTLNFIVWDKGEHTLSKPSTDRTSLRRWSAYIGHSHHATINTWTFGGRVQMCVFRCSVTHRHSYSTATAVAIGISTHTCVETLSTHLASNCNCLNRARLCVVTLGIVRCATLRLVWHTVSDQKESGEEKRVFVSNKEGTLIRKKEEREKSIEIKHFH